MFAQVMSHLPLFTFRRCVAAHRGDHKVQEFSCLDQFFAMVEFSAVLKSDIDKCTRVAREANIRAQ